MKKISPCLWFDQQAEEAAALYTSLFADSHIGQTERYDAAGAAVSGRAEGSVMTVACTLAGQDVLLLNGGPLFTFTPAISFFVTCKTAEEVDTLYAKLAEGGEVLMPLQKYDFSEKYAWVNDRFGVSWQLFVGDHPQKLRLAFTFVGDVAGKAEAAMQKYTSLFADSGIDFAARYPAGMPKDKEGTIMHASFRLAGQSFIAMDSAENHTFSFSLATSLIVECEDQAEIDHFWNALSAVPEAEQCGWLKDEFGVSWQIVPKNFQQYVNAQSAPIIYQMKKFDLAKMREAAGL